MPIIEWSDLYRVNIEELDQQHKQLLNIVNEFDEAVETKKEESKPKIKKEEKSKKTKSIFTKIKKLATKKSK